jgi:shikimate dehydrogenase
MTTMRAGLTGWPITQSLSPVIHGAWIGAAGLDATYQPFPAMDESAFDAVIVRGRQGEFLQQTAFIRKLQACSSLVNCGAL